MTQHPSPGKQASSITPAAPTAQMIHALREFLVFFSLRNLRNRYNRHLIQPSQDTALDRMPLPHLPHAQVDNISGLIEKLAQATTDAIDTLDIQQLRLDMDELLPTLTAASLLGFIQVNQNHILWTPIGHAFAEADIQQRKGIFRQQVMNRVWIMILITHTLQQKMAATPVRIFLDMLEHDYSSADAREQLATAVEWGRYAGLFEYDSGQEQFRLMPPYP